MILEIKDICKSFHQPRSGTLEVLKQVSFSLSAGETTAITGQSGSGKTTLLSLIAGLDSPDKGQVILDGEDLCVMKERAFHLNNILTSCPSLLSEREMFIIRERFLNEPSSTLKDIAIKIGVTRERVRQIESRSLRRIRSALEGSYSIFAEDFVPSYDYPAKGIRQ